MTSTSKPDSRGFTLIEMLMAMLVLTVGLLGLLQSVNVAFEHKLRNRLREEALVVAEEQMGNWRIMGFDNITTGSKASVARLIGGQSKPFTVLKEMASASSGATTSKRLRVAVLWDYKGRSYQHEIFTVKSR